VPGLPDVFAIGDTALAIDWEMDRPAPGIAPASPTGPAPTSLVLRSIDAPQHEAPAAYATATREASRPRAQRAGSAVAEFGG